MPVMQVSQQFAAIVMALAGAERIFEMVDTSPEDEGGDITLEHVDGKWVWKKPLEDGSFEYIPLKGDIRFNDVTFGYTDEKVILKNISLYAKPGQKIAFVGSTGAGKTTITNLINRFYDIQSGEITYDGLDIKSINKADLRKSLGVVLQDTHLFTGTVMDNIRYGRLDASDEDCIKAAKLANADFFITHLPEGYNTKITGDGANLSQGQRQLLAIARAMVSECPVLILDEATSSIDTRTEKLIEEGMDKLMEGRTVFVIAHRLSTVRNSHAIMVLEHGEIIERGDHDQLIAQKGKYYQLYTGAFELE
ncbi:MAG: ATP-binding cassette domain-containing protein, partial [Clostridia bacterium]|nr:ATP-binding cassette domain-containing protein [Clostridia bacterium]